MTDEDKILLALRHVAKVVCGAVILSTHPNTSVESRAAATNTFVDIILPVEQKAKPNGTKR